MLVAGKVLKIPLGQRVGSMLLLAIQKLIDHSKVKWIVPDPNNPPEQMFLVSVDGTYCQISEPRNDPNKDSMSYTKTNLFGSMDLFVLVLVITLYLNPKVVCKESYLGLEHVTNHTIVSILSRGLWILLTVKQDCYHDVKALQHIILFTVICYLLSLYYFKNNIILRSISSLFKKI
jgi:uncharacterized membrane protein (DUF373 family)